jgi:hypothetical protein
MILTKIEENLPEKAERFSMLARNFSGLRKFRVGSYRVINTIDDTVSSSGSLIAKNVSPSITNCFSFGVSVRVHCKPIGTNMEHDS